MARPPMTLAALVGADREVARDFLVLLGDTLAPGDDVVVCGPGLDPASPGAWWRAEGGTLAPVGGTGPLHDRVLVVDERAVPVGPWLGPLAAALDDPDVGAAAARTNLAAGDELLVGVPYRPHEVDVHEALVADLATGRAAERTPVRCLSGPSLSLRRPTLEAMGGLAALCTPDPVTGLAREVAAGGGALVVAEGAYLHHAGGPAPWPADPGAGPRPFVSACLITRDEERNLPRCLASIDGVADEVVVYDTGSSDRTVAIARSSGATVVEGHWDGDFARARNQALDRCQGQWVLWIDADEALACPDPAAVRRWLAELSSDVEGVLVPIDNLRANGASTTLSHPACRLFRRASGHWSGRLHEQVVARTGSPALALLPAGGVRVTHWGYLDRSIGDRDKGTRNLASAHADLTGDTGLAWATRLVSLGRSYGLAGRPEEAIALCRAGLQAAENPATGRLALRSIIENLLALDRAEEALAEIGRLRAITSAPMPADTLEGRALLELARFDEALAALGRVRHGLDDDGCEHSPHGVAAEKATALIALRRHDEAADVLLDGLRAEGGMDLHVGFLLRCLEHADRPFAELADAVPPDRAVAFLGQLVHLEADLADRVLEAWWRTHPARAVLATASAIASRLPVGRLRTWSERLRREGLAPACPLVATVAHPERTVVARALGAALAAEAFGDERGRFAFTVLALRLRGTERDRVRRRLTVSAPSLRPVLDALEPFAVRAEPRHGATPCAGAAGPSRSVLVVDRRVSDLRTLGVAAALRRAGHCVTLLHPEPVTDAAALLAPLGIDVRGWPAAPDAAGQARPLAATLARLVAERRFDAVVLARCAAPASDDVRRLLPAAHLVLDLDDGPGLPPAVPRADLVLSPRARPDGAGGAPVSVVPAPVADLFGPVAPVPEGLRTGICVVGSFGTAGDDELARLERVAGDLVRRAGSRPVAVVGEDPGGHVAGALPGSISVGPVADPLPWLRAARVVLAGTVAGAGNWLALAALAGTPGLVVPDDPEMLDQVAPAVAALAHPDLSDLWRRFAPAPVAAPARPAVAPRGGPEVRSDPAGTDPLAPLPPPRRRRVAMARPGQPAVRWRGDGRGCPTGSLRRTEAFHTVEQERCPSGGGSARRPGVEVWHGWPAELASTADRLVVEVAWPYGGLPAEWLAPIRDVVDELWVPTRWHRDRAVASGVDGAQVQVVPYGIDPEPFFPGGTRHRLATAARNALLFVGEPTERDGLDALLEAYLTTFSAADDVCLVVHLTGDRPHDGSVPGGGLLTEMVQRAADRPARGQPAVDVVRGPMTPEERADLYRSCDVLVQPHRAIADPVPMLEAMAGGLPVVLLDGGPGPELCDGRAGWPVRCRRTPVDPDGVGLTPSRSGFWWLEPDRASLAAALREAAGAPDRRLRKGLAARARAAGRCTLDDVAAAVRARLDALASGDASGAPAPPRSQEPVVARR